MADPIRQLLSQTSYDADGTTTVWNFSFAGGYLDREHVKVQAMDKFNLLVTQIPITDANFIGDYQLQLIPPIEVGQELTIYRDSPKDLPLVDFADRAALTEAALDLNAKQAIFASAEVVDTVNTSLAAVSQVGAQVAAAEGYAEGAAGHAADAANQALLAAAKATQANASAAASSNSAQDASDFAAAAAASAESVDTAFLLNRANHTGTQDASTVLVGGVNIKNYVDARPAGHLFQQDMWNGTRANIPAGYIPEDGQKVFDAAYPEAVAAIRSGKQYAITEAAWQADPLKRNCWSLGDGNTWVRAPDNNGVQPGSIGRLYKAGDGGALGGTAVGDAIRNITGQFESRTGAQAGYLRGISSTNTGGVFGKFGDSTSGGNTTVGQWDTSATVAPAGTPFGVTIDASRQVPTASENRPKTSYQCYIVRVSTGVSTDGTTDLEALAAEVAGAIAEIAPLKLRQLAFGDGQTRQNVTASRSPNVTYPNSTGRTIEILVSFTSDAAGQSVRVDVAGQPSARTGSTGAGEFICASRFVLPGETYLWSGNTGGRAVTVLEVR